VDELTRFARRLVEQLGAGREGVHRAIEVGALRTTVLPYRTHRRALGIDSVEDYETVLLRLVSGERGYVKTLPAEAAERCREELASSNPDLAVLDEVADATVQITSMAAAQVVGEDKTDGGDRTDSEDSGDRIPAPAKAEKPARKVAPSSPSPPSVPSAAATQPTCAHCHHGLPLDREVVFCPWCGKRLVPFTCGRCHTELDSRWKHCITCGAPVKDPHSYP
jgi:hypothetical protein